MKVFMVFDVESVGLHGEGFAVGWVVVSEEGSELECGAFACSPENAYGEESNRAWVAEHINLPRTAKTPREVRRLFWAAWRNRVDEAPSGVELYLCADVPWPVEARFLNACVDEDQVGREWEGPYPLIDVASVRFAAGYDPLANTEHRPDELPAHDPLADARHSARLLLESLPNLKQVDATKLGFCPSSSKPAFGTTPTSYERVLRKEGAFE